MMIKTTGIVRRVDELGRVVLPADVRRSFGIEERDRLEILSDEETGQIILRKASQMCLKCQSKEDLKEIKPGCCLCGKCLASLR